MKKPLVTTSDKERLKSKMNTFATDVLGLELFSVETDDQTSSALEGTVNMLIDIRKQARDNKDFATSDQIRDQLLALGVQLKDGKDGTTFSI